MNYRVLKIYFEINLWCPGSQFRWYESDWSKRDERKSGHLMNSRTLIKCTLCTFIVEQIRALRDILLLAIEPSIFFSFQTLNASSGISPGTSSSVI